jgi:hypothetical protein
MRVQPTPETSYILDIRTDNLIVFNILGDLRKGKGCPKTGSAHVT